MALNDEETRLVTEAQKALGDAKEAMKVACKSMRGMMKVQKDAGRTEAYAACYKVWAEFDGALNGIHRAHAVGTEALIGVYDEPAAGEIVLYGGGGGR